MEHGVVISVVTLLTGLVGVLIKMLVSRTRKDRELEDWVRARIQEMADDLRHRLDLIDDDVDQLSAEIGDLNKEVIREAALARVEANLRENLRSIKDNLTQIKSALLIFRRNVVGSTQALIDQWKRGDWGNLRR